MRLIDRFVKDTEPGFEFTAYELAVKYGFSWKSTAHCSRVKKAIALGKKYGFVELVEDRCRKNPETGCMMALYRRV